MESISEKCLLSYYNWFRVKVHSFVLSYWFVCLENTTEGCTFRILKHKYGAFEAVLRSVQFKSNTEPYGFGNNFPHD